MRTLLFTGHNADYNELARLTVPLMLKYARRWGLDFTCFGNPIINVPHGIYWTGVCGALAAFKDGYERVIYLDADQMITNMEIAFPDNVNFGFHASHDWGEDAVNPWQFSMCGFVAHKNAKGFLQSVLALEESWRREPFPEQGPAQMVVRKDPTAVILHARRRFNAVPDEVCPGKVPEPWQPGDFCAHLTMLPLEKRVELFHKIRKSLA